MLLAKPDWIGVTKGLFTPTMLSGEALLVALGILGATVMPHNLYLHSSLVQTRANDRSKTGIREAIKYNTIDTIVALGFAFFVNAAILVLAAAVFHGGGRVVEDFADAPALLKPLLGGAAATAFAVALLASGQSSTITGTLAGQIVMEGFLNIRVKPWLRRIITRGIAIIPAVAMIAARGESGTVDLLVLSQVVLSMQLSFAIFPLMAFTSDRRKMGEFANPLWLKVVGYTVCMLIAGLNLKLLFDAVGPIWFAAGSAAGLLFASWVGVGWKEPAPVESEMPVTAHS
jgi:manganese transport protein